MDEYEKPLEAAPDQTPTNDPRSVPYSEAYVDRVRHGDVTAASDGTDRMMWGTKVDNFLVI